MDQMISALDQKHLPLAIYMDLSKPVDMLNYQIFLKN